MAAFFKNKMQRSNFHTHSTFSDGHATIREMVDTAVSCGFNAIGFSDHSYAPLQTSYSMSKDGLEPYLEEIKNIRKEYDGIIRVYAGVELDGDSDINTEALDYKIASVHELRYKDKSYPVDWSAEMQHELADLLFRGSLTDYSIAYYDSVIKHVKKCSPDIIGHFDLVTKYSEIDEEDKRYREYATYTAIECLKYCDTFELNTGAIARKLRTIPYPAPYILKALHEKKARVIITSDCHYPERMTAWFAEAEKYLESLGFTHDEHGKLNEKINDIDIWY